MAIKGDVADLSFNGAQSGMTIRGTSVRDAGAGALPAPPPLASRRSKGAWSSEMRGRWRSPHPHVKYESGVGGEVRARVRQTSAGARRRLAEPGTPVRAVRAPGCQALRRCGGGSWGGGSRTVPKWKQKRLVSSRFVSFLLPPQRKCPRASQSKYRWRGKIDAVSTNEIFRTALEPP